jgi:hypothetical protein
MSLQGIATAGGGDFYFPPIGNHPARLVAILDLGWHPDTFKKAAVERHYWRNRGLFGWQLLIPESGVLFKEYALAFTPNADLRKLLERLRGKPFQEGDTINVIKMFEPPYLVSVSHQESKNGKIYANIAGVDRVPAGMTVPPATIQRLVWEFGKSPPLPAIAWLPTQWFGEKISDIIAHAKAAPPEPSTPAKEPAPAPATAATNGAAQTNGTAQTNAPAAPASPAAAADYPF